MADVKRMTMCGKGQQRVKSDGPFTIQKIATVAMQKKPSRHSSIIFLKVIR